MNPYLQDHWSNVHTALIGFIREALAEELPPDLSAPGHFHSSVPPKRRFTVVR